MSDLVDQLRKQPTYVSWMGLMRKAANTIEEHEAENARLLKRLAESEEDNANMRAALGLILGWDCIHPTPRVDLCPDFPWLKTIVMKALKRD